MHYNLGRKQDFGDAVDIVLLQDMPLDEKEFFNENVKDEEEEDNNKKERHGCTLLYK